jgi:uncharacterized membrane protein (UPF0127 family)
MMPTIRHLFSLYARLFVCACAACLLASGAHAERILARQRLQIGMYVINAEVANDEATRSHGLMGRKELAGNDGMLFVFAQPGSYAMWMKNTVIPLSVAFIDPDGVILNIEEMKPLTETPHSSAGQAKFALEMSSDWFAKKRINPGEQIRGLESAPPAR